MINFLVHANHLLVSSPRYSSPANVAVDKIYTPRIKDLILESSIIFESFGNAKTVRNDNSSRFGKYIKLQYSDSSELISSVTETFLLEQSRLVCVGESERNYHIFYQMLRGLRNVNQDLLNDLRLHDVGSFKILTMGNCTYANQHIDDATEFLALYQALYSLGCSDQLILGLWKILASILHLGNAQVHEANENGSICDIEIPNSSIKHIASMLGVNSEELSLYLLSTTLASGPKGGTLNTKPLSSLDSIHNINAVMKWLYSQVFAWIVSTVNNAHRKLVDTIQMENHELSEDLGLSSSMKFIGILDIFGFEILNDNSFEQLCINYTNERLQQQFNDYVFLSEQELYQQEGLDWKAISFKDNVNIIEVIDKKPSGLLQLLEEHSMMNRVPDDSALLATYNQHHEKNEVYMKSRFVGEGFCIKHFAGTVLYKIDGFLMKNNNSLQEELYDLLTNSSNPMLKQFHDMSMSSSSSNQQGQDMFFQSGPTFMRRQSLKRTLSRRMSSTITVSLQFRQQLDHLIKSLRETRPHYIKCIKPNDNKQPNAFNWPVVASQLRYSGVLEVVRIRREGYPIRLTFLNFYQKYYLYKPLFRRLYPDWKIYEWEYTNEELKGYCLTILNRCLKPSSYQVGINLICLHENGFSEMQKAMDGLYMKYLLRIQSLMRGYRIRQAFRAFRRGLVSFQSLIRGQQIRKKYSKYYGNIVDMKQQLLEWCDVRLDQWRAVMRDQYISEHIAYDGYDSDAIPLDRIDSTHEAMEELDSSQGSKAKDLAESSVLSTPLTITVPSEKKTPSTTNSKSPAPLTRQSSINKTNPPVTKLPVARSQSKPSSAGSRIPAPSSRKPSISSPLPSPKNDTTISASTPAVKDTTAVKAETGKVENTKTETSKTPAKASVRSTSASTPAKPSSRPGSNLRSKLSLTEVQPKPAFKSGGNITPTSTRSARQNSITSQQSSQQSSYISTQSYQSYRRMAPNTRPAPRNPTTVSSRPVSKSVAQLASDNPVKPTIEKPKQRSISLPTNMTSNVPSPSPSGRQPLPPPSFYLTKQSSSKGGLPLQRKSSPNTVAQSISGNSSPKVDSSNLKRKAK